MNVISTNRSKEGALIKTGTSLMGGDQNKTSARFRASGTISTVPVSVSNQKSQAPSATDSYTLRGQLDTMEVSTHNQTYK